MSTPLPIKTHFVHPPIPTRNFDWMAHQGDYEPGCTVGYGATEAEAVADLQEQVEDGQEEPVHLQEPVDKLKPVEHHGGH